MAHQKKEEAMVIIQRLEHQVADAEATHCDTGKKKSGISRTIAGKLLGYAAKRFSGANPDQAIRHVRDLTAKHPELSADELVEKLIKKKCQKTATIGAATSAASIIPGLGTTLSLTVGLIVDISTTLKLHAELVLEIAEAHGHRLTEIERNEVILAVTGLSTGISQFGDKAVKGLTHKVGEIAAQKWMAKAVPAIGMAASASTNILSTYIIGKRANTYFVRGPEAMGDLKDNLRALSGVDERKIARWISESSRTVAEASTKVGSSIAGVSRRGVGHISDVGRQAGRAVSSTADKVVETGKATGNVIVSGTGKASDVIAQAGMAAKTTAVDKAAQTINLFTRKNQRSAPLDGTESNNPG